MLEAMKKNRPSETGGRRAVCKGPPRMAVQPGHTWVWIASKIKDLASNTHQQKSGTFRHLRLKFASFVLKGFHKVRLKNICGGIQREGGGLK